MLKQTIFVSALIILLAPGMALAQDLTKELTSDCPEDAVGWTDMAVVVGTEVAKTYCFSLTYDGTTPVLVRDTLPAEWWFVASEDLNGNELNVAQANKKSNNKSATKLGWWLLEPADPEMLVVQAETRCKNNRHNSKCAPTSCGALYLNDGAAAYELDENGMPLVDEFGDLLPPIAESESICLAAVKDVDESGDIDPSGEGDEDADGYSDWEEACVYGTNPCMFDDADGDGIHDLEDPCPLDPDNDVDGDGLCGDVDPCPDDATNTCNV